MRYVSYFDENRDNKYWDNAHAKNPDNYETARLVIYAPEKSDLHEITLHCIKTLDSNGAWDFEREYIEDKCTNIVYFKYNGTITALNAISELNYHCEHKIKWEFITA